MNRLAESRIGVVELLPRPGVENTIVSSVVHSEGTLEGGTEMPTATVEGPSIKDLDTKRSLTREITDALERAYKLPRQVYVVVIRENPPENVCVGGELVCDRVERKKGS
jgi:4-oxalocrotonate tautomerase